MHKITGRQPPYGYRAEDLASQRVDCVQEASSLDSCVTERRARHVQSPTRREGECDANNTGGPDESRHTGCLVNFVDRTPWNCGGEAGAIESARAGLHSEVEDFEGVTPKSDRDGRERRTTRRIESHERRCINLRVGE